MRHLPLNKKRITKRKVVAVSGLILGTATLGVGLLMIADNFFDHNDLNFRSPVIFQSPIEINKRVNKIISPVSLVEKAEASTLVEVEEVEVTVTPEPKTPKEIVKAMTIDAFGVNEWSSMEDLVHKESSWNHLASNSNGGACGLFQAYPCAKLSCDLEDVACQAEWGINYIKNRYGTPSKALAFWKSRQPINGRDVGHWY